MSSYNNLLLTNFLNAKGSEIKENTKKTYTQCYAKMLSLLPSKRKRLTSYTENEILEYLAKHEGDKAVILAIVIGVLSHAGKPVSKLKEKKHNLHLEYLEKVKNVNHEITKDLPTYEELTAALKNTKDNDTYMLLFLLLKFSTRNLDLMIKKVKSLPEELTENYFLIKDDKVFYIRGNYKTLKRYGIKMDQIEDAKMIELINQKPYDQYIFKTKTGKPYDGSSMSHLITGKLNKIFALTNLTQSKIYKIKKLYLDKNNDLRGSETAASARGHSMDISSSCYRSTPSSDEEDNEIIVYSPRDRVNTPTDVSVGHITLDVQEPRTVRLFAP